MEDAIDTANAIASEHLEILTKNPFEVMTKIKNAGAIFLGEYSSPSRYFIISSSSLSATEIGRAHV